VFVKSLMVPNSANFPA